MFLNLWERTIKTTKGNIHSIHHSSVTPPMNGLGILLSDHLSPLLHKSKSPCWKCFHISLCRSPLVSHNCHWEKKKRWWDQEVSSFHFRLYLHLWYEEDILRRLLGAEKGTRTKLPAQMLLSLLLKQDEGRVVVFLVRFTPKGWLLCLFAIPISLLFVFTHGMELTLHEWLGIAIGKITDRPVYLELLLRGKCGFGKNLD